MLEIGFQSVEVVEVEQRHELEVRVHRLLVAASERHTSSDARAANGRNRLDRGAECIGKSLALPGSHVARGRRSTTCVITPLPFAPIRRTTAPAFWRPRRRNHGLRGTWWRRWVRSFTRTRFTPGFVRRRRRRWVVPLLIPLKPLRLDD